MLRSLAAGMLRAVALCCVAGVCFAANDHRVEGQEPSAGGAAPVRVLMVSDIHFDPFTDPGKVEKLSTASADGWDAILKSAPSPDRAARVASLEKACPVKGSDTDYALLASSVSAMRAGAAGARFIVVSGDLLAHNFSCKYSATLAHATAAGYNAFAAKTLEFVMDELRSVFPGVPVYTALGNNDSGCGDYRIDAGGDFLRAIAPALSADIRVAERKQARRDILAGGYYSVELPAPMERTRLVVLDDVFMSRENATCGGEPDPAAAAKQIAWLRSQLEEARREHGKVWVMAHVPPGIDPYSSIRKLISVCAGGAPETFLSSNAFPDAIAEFGDVVRLTIFGHTHMDELRLVGATKPGSEMKPVPLKIVPSISPIHQNEPAFAVASVDPASAILKDYEVIAASNGTGVGTEWREEYDFDRAYGEKEFSGDSIERLIAGFRADPEAKTPASQEYLRDYYAGDRSALLKLFWPQYACALANDTADGFRSCACGGGPTH